MNKENIKHQTLESIVLIQSIINDFDLLENKNKFLLFENLKKLKNEFLNFFDTYQKGNYEKEYFLINIKRILGFYNKKLLSRILDFLKQFDTKEKMLEIKIQKFHIKFLIFVI